MHNFPHNHGPEVVHAPRPLNPSAVAACEAALAQIDRRNGETGALTDILHGDARQAAAEVDRKLSLGLEAGRIAGWCLAVKDNIDTYPARCPAGLSFLRERRPERDAEVVRRLRQEGAAIVGVAYTDSGAFGVLSPGVLNPHYPDLVAGGSSGGSAAAVAAGLCTAALGTDTGGSVRIPAACCGIVGFKPTKGRLPTQGVRPLSESADHVGVMSGTVARVRQVFEAMDSGGARPHATLTKDFMLGVPLDFFADACPEVRASMQRAMDLLKASGMGIQPVELGQPDSIIDAHVVLALTEAALAHEESTDGIGLSDYPQVAQEGIRFGLSCSATSYLQATRSKADFTAKVENALASVDALLLPTLPVGPPGRQAETVVLGGRELGLLNALIRYTAAFNQTGHPAIAVPTRLGQLSHPFSVQLVGRLDGDLQMLDIAEMVENILGTTIDN